MVSSHTFRTVSAVSGIQSDADRFFNCQLSLNLLFASVRTRDEKHRNQIKPRADHQGLIEAGQYRNHQRGD